MTESDRRDLLAAGIPSARVSVVPPCVDVDAFATFPKRDARQRVRRELAIPCEAPVVLGIGRFAPQKDPHTFVRILATVQKRFPDVVGIWLGDDGPLKDPTLRLARELGVEQAFRVLGWQPDVRPFFAAADVFLSTSEFESFGYVTAEALAMGLPAVATRITGSTDILQAGSAGFLFAAG